VSRAYFVAIQVAVLLTLHNACASFVAAALDVLLMCVSLCRLARRRSTSLSLLCGMCVPCQLAGHQLLPVSLLVTAARSCSFRHRMDSSDYRVCVQCDYFVLCSHFLVYSAVGCEFETLNCGLSSATPPLLTSRKRNVCTSLLLPHRLCGKKL
jgi:hypothetical protein